MINYSSFFFFLGRIGTIFHGRIKFANDVRLALANGSQKVLKLAVTFNVFLEFETWHYEC
jgi:hypothetical protein